MPGLPQLDIRQIEVADLSVLRTATKVAWTESPGWHRLVLRGPMNLDVIIGTNDNPLARFFCEMFRTESAGEAYRPDIQVRTSFERTFQLDQSAGAIALTGPAVPFTLVKQAYRWILAYKCWKMQLPILPLHATVVAGVAGAVAIVGRGQSGKTHLTRAILEALPDLQLVSDDWGLLDVRSNHYERGTERFLHLRQGDTPLTSAGEGKRLLFEEVVCSATDDQLKIREQRYLVQSGLPEMASVPLRGMILLSHFSVPSDGVHTGDSRHLPKVFGNDLCDQSLEFLPSNAVKWLTDQLHSLADVRLFFESSFQSNLDVRSRNARCARFVASIAFN